SASNTPATNYSWSRASTGLALFLCARQAQVVTLLGGRCRARSAQCLFELPCSLVCARKKASLMLASDVCGGEENGIRAQKGIPANIGRRSSNPPQLLWTY